MSDEIKGADADKPRWQPLSRVDRRVAGVLIEKAKTTPGAYPMTLNAITTGCNQKSNRFPVMQLTPEEVEESLERMRGLGAIGIIEGYGRVDKYRHYLYDWLAVEKVELSVIGELLLRGPQTVGELRGRASRMDPIADLATLRPILNLLEEKGLLVFLTPEGRGQVVSHALYPPQEMEKVRAEHAGAGAAPERPVGNEAATSPPTPVPTAHEADRDAGCAVPEIAEMHDELSRLREDLVRLQGDHDELAEAFRKVRDELQRLREDLGA